MHPLSFCLYVNPEKSITGRFLVYLRFVNLRPVRRLGS
jgi:hypothetical protein